MKKDDLRRLGIQCLDNEQKVIYDKVMTSPVKIMQIGEGNFLMSFFDWMVYQMIKAGKYDGSIALSCSLNSNFKTDILKEQDNLYTVVQRGFKGDMPVNEKEIISVFSKIFNYTENWEEFLHIAEQESLEVIISNTTEAGLVYKKVTFDEVAAEGFYPAKLTAFLMHRFATLGDTSSRLLIFPCELVAENGKVLEKFVRQHAADFDASQEFLAWLERTCVFLNNLVDRIVPGYPANNDHAYFEELGYVDKALSLCEPYFLWAIEGDKAFDEILPLAETGLNVEWLESFKDIQLLKVRILNGSHTLITPLGILKGFKQVDEVVEDEAMKAFLTETLHQEILPSINNETGDKEAFAATTLSRFRNPHIMHKLESISMNSVSKFVNRLLPTLKTYVAKHHAIPANMAQSLAGLIRFYQVEKTEQGYVGKNFAGETYKVFDTEEVLVAFAVLHQKYPVKNQAYVQEVLTNITLWGEDLSLVEGLSEAVYKNLETWGN